MKKEDKIKGSISIDFFEGKTFRSISNQLKEELGLEDDIFYVTETTKEAMLLDATPIPKARDTRPWGR